MAKLLHLFLRSHAQHLPTSPRGKKTKTRGSTDISYSNLQIVNQKCPEISAPSKQHITVGLEDTAFHKDAAVAEEVPLPLLIELKQQFGQIARHFHVSAPVSPAREKEE